MAEYTPSALSTFTTFFSSEHIEDTARRTGFVQRVSHMTGNLFLAVVTCGVWSDPQTTLAPLAAQGALTLLQERLRQALATVQGLDKVGDDGLFPAFTTVYLADSPGCGLPDRLKEI